MPTSYDVDKDRRRPLNYNMYRVTVFDLQERVLAKFNVGARTEAVARETVRDEIVHRPTLRENLGRVESKMVRKEGTIETILIRGIDESPF